jgi:hypothetical protein
MSVLLTKVQRRFNHLLRIRALAEAKRAGQRVELSQISRSEWPTSLSDPLAFYFRCFGYFHSSLPAMLVEHRKYFTQNQRGFGEDAFHVMWFLLYTEFGFTNFLEIGVYRGQVLSLISLLQRVAGAPGSVCGVSPFLPAGDSVSRYSDKIDYLADTRANFAAFHLSEPDLLKAYSTDPVALEKIASRVWDCIYIDGCHDYEVAREDWAHCAAAIRPGGLIILDDSGLETNYVAPKFAFAGHLGPSRLAQEVDRTSFEEILQVGHNRVFQRRSP